MNLTILVIALTVCFMSYVDAGADDGNVGPSCADQTDIDRMNGRVYDIFNGLRPVMQNQSLTEAEKMPIIFNMTCHNPYKAKLEQIEAQVEGCPGLLFATSSHLDDLTYIFFGTKFSDVLQYFENVADFCACRTLIPEVWTIKSKIGNLETTIPGPVTTLFDPSVLCSLATVKNVSGVIYKAYELDMLINNNNPECTKLPTATGFTGTTQMLKVTGFVEDKCPSVADLAMYKDTCNCVVAELDNAGAKECFTNASDSSKCSRRKCVTKHAMDCTEMGIEAYIYGVNLYKDKAWISTYDCDSATSVKTSVVLLFVAVLKYFL